MCRCSQAVLSLVQAKEDAGGEVRRSEAEVLGVAAQLGKGVVPGKRARPARRVGGMGT